MNLNDPVEFTLLSTSRGHQIKIDHEATMTTVASYSDNFDDFTIPLLIDILIKSKTMPDTLLAPSLKSRKKDPEIKKSAIV